MINSSWRPTQVSWASSHPTERRSIGMGSQLYPSVKAWNATAIKSHWHDQVSSTLHWHASLEIARFPFPSLNHNVKMYFQQLNLNLKRKILWRRNWNLSLKGICLPTLLDSECSVNSLSTTTMRSLSLETTSLIPSQRATVAWTKRFSSERLRESITSLSQWRKPIQCSSPSDHQRQRKDCTTTSLDKVWRTTRSWALMEISPLSWNWTNSQTVASIPCLWVQWRLQRMSKAERSWQSLFNQGLELNEWLMNSWESSSIKSNRWMIMRMNFRLRENESMRNFVTRTMSSERKHAWSEKLISCVKKNSENIDNFKLKSNLWRMRSFEWILKKSLPRNVSKKKIETCRRALMSLEQEWE